MCSVCPDAGVMLFAWEVVAKCRAIADRVATASSLLAS